MQIESWDGFMNSDTVNMMRYKRLAGMRTRWSAGFTERGVQGALPTSTPFIIRRI